MKKITAHLLFPLLALWTHAVEARADKEVVFIRKHDSDGERAVQQQLERLLQQYDLSRWRFTDTVQIEEKVISHSHPVLTINTRTLGKDLELLALFLHEQIHWPLHQDSLATRAAIEDLKRVFPQVPVGRPEGAHNELSTYLHLLVCYSEYAAMTELIGEEKARALMQSYRMYTWIYKTVLERTEIKAVIERHGFTFYAQA